MSKELEVELRDLIAEKRVLVVVGAGVSMGATQNAPAASWQGLLKHGAHRCRQLDPSLSQRWEENVVEDIQSGRLRDLLIAGERLSRELGAHGDGELTGWLRETVGSLKTIDFTVLEALRDLGLPLATTNYDDLLEEVTKLRPVTWRNRTEVFRVLRGEDPGILHLHGHWRELDSIVLGTSSYDRVKADALARGILQGQSYSHSLLFVGCGDGLSDPNFEAFRGWLGAINGSNEARHFRLSIEKERELHQRQHHRDERVFVLSYGKEHRDLAPFLRRLIKEPALEIVSTDTRTLAKSVTATVSLTPAVRAYLKRLESRVSKLQLLSLGQGVQLELPIQQAYIPLSVVMARTLHVAKPGRFETSAVESMGHAQDAEVSEIFRLGEQMGHRGVILLGDPGSGKTTGARQFCWRMLTESDLPKALGVPDGMIPVFLRLRFLTELHLKMGLNAFIEDAVAVSDGVPEPLRRPGCDLLATEGILWVFDGLDEVVNEDARVRVCGWIRDAHDNRPMDRFLVTCRYQGYHGKVELGPSFARFQVRSLDAGQVAVFVDHWYRAVYRKLYGIGSEVEAKAARSIESLMGLLRQHEYQIGRLRDLPANPLMLTILCLVHHENWSLPRRRADLYARCVRVLVEHWHHEVRERQGLAEFDPEAAEAVLACVAWWLHEERGRTASPDDVLGGVAGAALAEIAESAGLGRNGVLFIQRMRNECGILAMLSAGQCGFLHLTFQEYLAGQHAARENRVEELVRHFGESWWRELILVAVATGSRGFIQAFFTALLKTEALTTHHDLVQQCIDEARQLVADPFIEVLEDPASGPTVDVRKVSVLKLLKQHSNERITEVCKALLNSSVAEISGLAREVLFRSGVDVATGDRSLRGSGVFVDAKSGIAFVRIPEGEFWMGSRKGTKDERPVHRVQLDEFMMGCYPVTNEEYARFLKESGHRVPEEWHNSQFNAPRQPVVGVSWEDARKFCEWAGGRLPSEAEWEYACRAGTKSEFAFGDSLNSAQANFDGNHPYGNAQQGPYLGKTSPVGSFTPNQWGLYDMHGNVWEWCEDWYAADFYSQCSLSNPVCSERSKARIIRGGGWRDYAAVCRSAFRGYVRPSGRENMGGFRVVLASSSVPQ